MKTLMLLTVLVVLVAAASAIWSGDRGDDTQGGYRGSGGSRGDYESHRSWKAGRDRDRENDWGSRHRGGRHRGSHRHDKYMYWRICSCRTQCEGNTGTKLIGCFTNRASYLQCKDTNCSVEACPDNQLFNVTTLSCEACPAGFRVDANKRRCVCDQGTTFDYRTRTCVPCPTGATITPDKCYCNNSVLHKSENTCKPCPEGSTKNKRGCFCTDTKAFFSFQSFSCQQCPGVWVSRSDGRRRSRRPVEVCECQGVNQIFNRWTVACMTCPDDSVATTKKGKSYCDCTAIGQRYDWKVGKCVNRHDNDDDDDDDNDDDNDDRDTD